jgi:hypothetical protein
MKTKIGVIGWNLAWKEEQPIKSTLLDGCLI